MSFIALDICGGRFAKGCSIMGVIAHALSDDASDLPFFDQAAAKRWIHHETAFSPRTCSFVLRLSRRGLSAIFRINLIIDFIT
jgi:hypothetical protein